MIALLALTAACGYHTTGNNGPRLPSDLHTMYVPGLQDASLTYHIGQTFTEALIKELRERTNYRIITTNDGTADAMSDRNHHQRVYRTVDLRFRNRPRFDFAGGRLHEHQTGQ